MRKRSSLSSSSTSSALSTPSVTGSAPPGLTDDDDSMSDPEFMLDQQLRGRQHNREESEVSHKGVGSQVPSLTYARRPSTTNTRSTIPAGLLTPDSAQSQMSMQEQQQQPVGSRRMRPRHAHHLSVPMVHTLFDDEDERVFGDDEQPLVDSDGRPLAKPRVRPQSLGLGALKPKYDRDASYATLTAATAAEAIASAINDQNVTVKQRRHSVRSRPRGSLPAYFSLLKINATTSSSPRQQDKPVPSDSSLSPSAKWGSSAFGVNPFYSSNSRESSPGSAGTATGRSGPRARSKSHLHSSAMHIRATPAEPDLSTLHGVGSISKSSCTASGCISMSLQQRGRKTTLTQKSVNIPEPDFDAPTSAGSQEAKPFEHAMMTSMMSDTTQGQGTPRGRTRSRSQRPSLLRSRSRSRSRRPRHIANSPLMPNSGSREFDRVLDNMRRDESYTAFQGIIRANAVNTRGRRRGVRRGSRSGSRERPKRLVSTEPALRGAQFGGYGFAVGNGVGYGYAAEFWDGAAAGEEMPERERGRGRGRTESRGRRRSRSRDRSWIRQKDMDRADMLAQQHLRQLEQQNERDLHLHHALAHVHVEPVIFENVEGSGHSEIVHAPVDPAIQQAAEDRRGRKRGQGVPIRA